MKGVRFLRGAVTSCAHVFGRKGWTRFSDKRDLQKKMKTCSYLLTKISLIYYFIPRRSDVVHALFHFDNTNL